MIDDDQRREGMVLSRKQFLAGLVAAPLMASATRSGATPAPIAQNGPAKAAQGKPKIAAFIKFLQPMPPAEMADYLADAGFDGVEATVRANGYVDPAQVAERLPRFADALDKRGLKIFAVTTDITSITSPHADAVLKTAASLGIKKYRLGFLKYDLSKPVADQLYALRPTIAALAQLNQAHGIMGVYQNHGEPEFVGAAIWDYHELIKDLPREQMSFVYDTWHAVAEGGTTWPTTLNLARSHLGLVSVKDFRWNRYVAQGAPLGTGVVNPQIFKKIREVYDGEYSLHVEYEEQSGLAANKAAFARDVNVLRTLLA